MKARGKLVSLLMALVCLLPIGVGLLGFGDSASAATPEKIDVTLHKKKMDDFPTNGIQNNGLVMPDFDNDYDPLPGVEFRPYDITKDFYTELAKENLTGNETDDVYNAAVKRVMEKFQKATYTPKDADAVAPAQTTGADGKVVFADLDDRDADGTYKVYLFFETDNPANEQYSQPLVLMLPAKHPDTQQPLKDIHLYPKNKLENKPDKELLDDEGNPVDKNTVRVPYDVGKKIQYKATFMMPNQIGEILQDGNGNEVQTRYSKLVFKDKVDTKGLRFNGIEQILIGGQNVPVEDFTGLLYADTVLTNYGNGYDKDKEAGFEIAMKLNDKTKQGDPSKFGQSRTTAQYLETFKGQKIEIFYSVQFTEDTPTDADVRNDFSVTLRQKTDTEDDIRRPEVVPPPVVTGGKKFIKHEFNKEEQTLKGAEFVVTKKDKDNNDVYLTGTPNEYTWTKVTDNKYTGAIKLTSQDGGLFEIKGLKYGKYWLVETKAPNGFKLADAPIEFDVAKNSYDVELPLRDKIANISRDGFLPSTGGAGIIAFLVIGLSLMGIAVFRYRKTQHAA